MNSPDSSPQRFRPRSDKTQKRRKRKSAQSDHLFVTNLKDNKIHLPNVRVNNRNTISSFKIRNVCNHEISIKMTSSLPELKFQLSNENLIECDSEENYNQIFNFFNLVDRVNIKPGETKEIVLLFRPQLKKSSQQPPTKLHFVYHLVTGTIVLSSEIVGTINDFHDKRKTEEKVIEFSAKVCRSYLETDVSDLDFGNCITGETYVKDFTVWNRSEIPLDFALNMHESQFCDVEFTKYETGEPIGPKTTIPGHSHLRISVSLKPKKSGDIESDIFVENLHDERNISIIKLHAITMSEREEGIVIRDVNGSLIRSLNFGDCYAYSSVCKILVVKNVSKDKLDVLFDSDIDQISFEILPEEDDETKQSPTKSEGEFIPESVDSRNIEEQTLMPGGETKIQVWYTPEPEKSEDEIKLVPRKFKIGFQCRDPQNREKILFSTKIQCRASVCTSIVEVLQHELKFGDCTIGSFAYASVQVANRSDLPAKISVEFVSQVLTCAVKTVTLGPHQIIPLKFRLSPRKINPNYRKQVTIVNLNNKNNYNIIMITSNNVDRNMLMFHALFYDVHTSSEHNFAKNIDFKNVAVNNTSMRTFALKNITKKPIKLELSVSSPQEIRLFKAQLLSSVESTSNSSKRNKEKFLASMEEHTSKLKLRRKILEQDNEKSPPGTPQLDFDLHKITWPLEKMNTDTAKGVFSDYLSHLTKAFTQLPYIPIGDAEGEEKYVKYRINVTKSLERAIIEGLLEPCHQVSLGPEEECIIYVVFKPSARNRPNLSGILKKIEETLYISLVEFDKGSTKEIPKKDIPPRQLSIQANVCLSLMNIAQKHINFGSIVNTEERIKTLKISNTSEVPLIYKIKKTGSVASGDLVLEGGRYGIVRPYGSKDLKMLFKPSLSGNFREFLTIINVQDPTDTNVITVKAFIKQHERFLVKPTELKFQDVLIGTRSVSNKIILTNTTKGRRIFEIRADHTFKGCKLAYEFDMELSTTSSGEIEKLEAELEKCEHKLRIATRKGKVDKVKKIKKRIEEIKKSLHIDTGEKSTSDDHFTSSGDEKKKNTKKRFKKLENGVRVAIPAQGTQIISLIIVPLLVKDVTIPSGIEKGTGTFVVFEKKNTDLQKTVAFNMTVYYNRKIYDAQVKQKSQSMQLTTGISDIPPPPVMKRPTFESKALNLFTKETLVIRPKEIDLGKVSIGEELHCRITITSVLTRAGFVILAPHRLGLSTESDLENNKPMKFKFSIKNGLLEKGESVAVDVICEPQSSGPQRHNITIQNLQTKVQHGVIILCNPQRASPVTFPNLMQTAELDFGNCYIDKSRKYAKMVPFDISNTRDETLSFDVCSNTKTQVYIFQDEKCEHPATNVVLPPHGTKKLYICLKPYLSDRDFENGRCRVLVGGLKVKIFDEHHKQLLHEKIIKFKAVVGHSILQCSRKLVDFGCIPKSDEFVGMFTLRNLNQYLPLEYKIEKCEDVVLDSTEGRLGGTKEEGSTSVRNIRFKYTPKSSGLNVSTIKIHNNMSTDGITTISFRAFVNDSTKPMKLQTIPQPQVVAEGGEKGGIDTAKFKDIYVIENDQKLEIIGKTNTTTITIKNTSDRLLRLVAQSDISVNLSVKDAKVFQPEKELPQAFKWLYNFVGSPFELEQGKEATLTIELKSIPEVDAKQMERIRQLKKISIFGTLLLLDVDSLHQPNPDVLKMFHLKGHACISEGRLIPSEIQLGKFGHTNGWKNLQFKVVVRNRSEIPLALKPVSIADELHLIVLEKEISIAPMSTRSFEGILIAKKFSKQTAKHVVRKMMFINENNPKNTMTLVIHADLTSCIWNFTRLNSHNQLILPQLELPASQSSPPCENFFNMANMSASSVNTKYSIVVDPKVKSILKLEIRDFTKNIPLTESAVASQEVVGVRVRCNAIPNARIPKSLLHLMTTEKSNPLVLFGEIRIQSTNQPTEVIKIYGNIKQNPTFSLSAKRLRFRSIVDALKDKVLGTFSIKNICTDLPLNYEIKTHVPENTKMTLKAEPSQGQIEPDEYASIQVSIEDVTDPETFDFPENVYLEVIDLKTPLSTQTIAIEKGPATDLSFEESPTPSIIPDFPEFSSQTEKGLPVLVLKNCTAIGTGDPPRQFEINIGQQNHNSPDVEWDLTLENISRTSADYRIHILDDDMKWLKISRTQGTLANKNNSHVITLTFSTKELGIYSTYLVVENLQNPRDMKIIRISMETVASGKVAGNKYFQVLVGDSNVHKNNVLNLGEVFLGEIVRHGYIDVVNLVNIPLEFQLTSNLPSDSATELHFSLSLTSLKSFHTLRVEPHSKTRVYLLFEAHAPGIQPGSDSNVQRVEIYVRCRLVKDYQEVVVLQARCSKPQMRVSTRDLMFIEEQKNPLKVTPSNSKIVLTNLSDSELRYALRNDSMFFEVSAPKRCVIDAKQQHTLTVKPNISKLQASKLLIKDKYIEEHFTIYNKMNLKEKFWISLRFSRGNLKQFYSAPGPKSAYAFSTLEDRVAQFLIEFNSLCQKNLNSIDENMPESESAALIAKMFKRKALSKLYFELNYITDELVYYGLMGKAGQSFFDLAKLLYTMLFSNKIFSVFTDQLTENTIPHVIKRWKGQLTHFLSFFHHNPDVAVLQQLEEQINQQKTKRKK